MGVGAGPYMYVVVVQKFTFAISSPDEFLSILSVCRPRPARPASHAHFRHGHIPELICGFNMKERV